MNTESPAARTLFLARYHKALRISLADLALLVAIFSTRVAADPSGTNPTIHFVQGLVGKQVCLQWDAQPGVEYVVQKTASLTAQGSPGGFSPVARVTAEGAACTWVDPEIPGPKAFYRIEIPQPQVFALEPPVISSKGGDIFLRAQCLPAGSFFVLESAGHPPVFADLVPVAGQPGLWRAAISPGAIAGIAVGSVLTASVVDANGITVASVSQTVTVTETGFATDAPPWLPPATPSGGSTMKTVLGTFTLVGCGLRSHFAGEDCDDGNDDGGAPFLSKKGYDYYKAQSDLSSAGALTNPYFKTRAGPKLYTRKAGKDDFNVVGPSDVSEPVGGLAGGAQSWGTAGSGGGKVNWRDFDFVIGGGLPGEISAEQCDLDLPSPAGPSLAWVRTYRSMAPVTSGHGSGWDFSYNIYIEPIPLAAGVNAPQVAIHDGSGRRDVYQRQADGTYRCDGMFREGHFNPDTSFTLTFADKGTWIFCQLVGAPWSGRIGSITDRNGVSLTCTYNNGQLATVSDAFGRSLSVVWDASGQISSVSDSTGRSVFYTQYAAGEPGGGAGDLKSVSCPQVGGLPPAYGPTTYTYTSGFADDRLNHNLTSATDGEGRNLGAFTYATTVVHGDPDFDTVASVRKEHELAGHVILIKIGPAPSGGANPSGGVVIYENDEVGRVSETTCDRMHRPLRLRLYTGFAMPGVPVTETTNRPTGKLRATDPDFYETTFAYNAQHCCTVCIEPDGLQTRCTYQYDLSGAACPVRERGNVRVCTLVSPGGEQRTVSMEYLPGFGAHESPEPELIRDSPSGSGGGKRSIDPSGTAPLQPHGPRDSPSRPRIAGGGGGIWDGGEDGGPTDTREINQRNLPTATVLNTLEKTGLRSGGSVWDGGDGDSLRESPSGGGYIHGNVGTPVKHGPRESPSRLSGGRPKQKMWMCANFRTSLTTTLGQIFTNTYDASGNCTASRTPIAGAGCDLTYNARGQCTSITELNGAGSSFRTDCAYDAAKGFCTSVIRDPAGLHLTISFDRDANGRITRVVDERGFDWLATYNAADQCVQTQTPMVGSGLTASRISTDYFYDAGGLPSGCDVEHRDATGASVAANPTYSVRYIRESPTRPGYVTRVAVENRPVSLAPGSTDIAAAGLENFDVCDYTYNAAGECVEKRTPAVCLAQSTDLVTSYQFDERGMLYHCIDGAPGTTNTVAMECDYTPAGSLSRCATLVSAGAESPTTTYLYDGFRRCISSTDPMGNVETYSYDNQGYVTCSRFGELDDVPGSSGNVLLSRVKVHFYWDRCGKSDELDTNIRAETVWNKQCVEKDTTVRLADQDYSRSAFFDVFLEDVTCTVERFTPGVVAAPVLEITTFDCSPAGLVQSVSTNGDLLAACTYDSAARGVAATNGAYVRAYTLDAAGNIIAATRTDLSSAGGSSTVGTSLTAIYDSIGRAVQIAEGGNVATCAFDSLDRILRDSPPSGAPIVYDYDGGTPGQPYSVRTSSDVDGDGTPETLGSSYARSCPKRYKIKIDIGPPRPPIFGRSVTNSNGDTTTFIRDSQGRCFHVSFPDGSQESCEFDNLGRCVSEVRKTGGSFDYTYNLDGQVLSMYTGPCKPPYLCDFLDVPATTYHYNGRGDCTRLTQGTSDMVRIFDSCGNLLSESQNGHLVQHTYTHRGRASTTYPDGSRFNEVRNAQGLLLSCSAQGSAGPAIFSAQYQGYRPVQETRANGVLTTWLYRGPNDAAVPGTGPDFTVDACVQCTVSAPGGAVLSRSNYNRDASQRLIRRETLFSGEAGNVSPLRRQLITRDPLGRVTRMVTGQRPTAGVPIVLESDVTYTLDLEGQRLQAVGGTHPGPYTASATLPPGDRQMHQYTAWPDGPLEWDENGSLTLFSHGASGAHQLVYDACSRLVAVVDNGSGAMVASYGYDADDRLISRTIPNSDPLLPPVTTFFIYDGSECIVELGADGLADLTFAAIGHCIISRNGTYVYPHGGGTSTGVERRSFQKAIGFVDRRTCSASFTQLMTGSTGAPIERFDVDDGGQPIFLTSDGIVRQGATTALSGYRWILRYSSSSGLSRLSDSAWCPESELLMCSGGTYSPALGQAVSAHKTKPKEVKSEPKKEYVGHVSLLK